MRVTVHGAGGKMGLSVLKILLEETDHQITGAIDHPQSSLLGKDIGSVLGKEKLGVSFSSDLSSVIQSSDVIIDFSLPAAFSTLLEQCKKNKTSLVTGTTGLDEPLKQQLTEAAKEIAILSSPNFSLGVNLLFHLAEQATKIAGSAFDAEIIDMHHKHKVDAPSGTAVKLTEVVRKAKDASPEDIVYGRHGHVGPRKENEIGVMTLRGGDVVGDHTLILAGPGERIEITHKAHSREIFARGAVKAAPWLAKQQPGLYDMSHMINNASSF